LEQNLSFADNLYTLAQSSPTMQKLIAKAAGDILVLKKALGTFSSTRLCPGLCADVILLSLPHLQGLFENPYGSMSNPNIPTVGGNSGTHSHCRQRSARACTAIDIAAWHWRC
jgi:hypothetical protein